MNSESSSVGLDPFIKQFTENVLKNVVSAKVIQHLDGHRAHCSSALLFENAVKNNVSIIHLRVHYSRTLHVSEKSFCWPFKRYLKNEAVTLKIIRYRVALLIWFAWSNVASVRVGVSAFRSAVRVPEYMFSISDTSETIISMDTASPNMAIICVISISVINSQNLLPFSPEPH